MKRCLTFIFLLLAGPSLAQPPAAPSTAESMEEMVDQLSRAAPTPTRLNSGWTAPAINPDELGPGNIYSKIQALDGLLNLKPSDPIAINWKQVFADTVTDIDSSKYNDINGSVPFLLGVRIADGVFAVYLRDKEALNNSAEDIRDFARKLGLPEADLKDAEEVRQLAISGKWMHVIAQLGFIQMRVIEQLRKAQPDQRRLILLGGWVQGARITARAIASARISTQVKAQAGYFDPSYTLRDPLLVDALIKMLGQLGPRARTSPAVLAMKASLPAVKSIVDIPLDPQDPGAKIPSDNLAKLQTMATEIMTRAIHVQETSAATVSATVIPATPEPAITEPGPPTFSSKPDNVWGWIALGVAILFLSVILMRQTRS